MARCASETIFWPAEQADPLKFVGITGLRRWASLLASKLKGHIDVYTVAVPRSVLLPDFHKVIRCVPTLETARLLKMGVLGLKVAFHFLASHTGLEGFGV